MDTRRFSEDVRLAKSIEAGLLAREILERGETCSLATQEELLALSHVGEQAKERLILGNLGLVGVIALEVARRLRAPYEELYQEGCLALQEAVMRYDWRKGPFGPYAGLWIRSALRSTRVRPWMVLAENDQEDAQVVAQYDQFHQAYALSEILEFAPDQAQSVVKLRHGWAGRPRSLREVATVLELPVRRVKALENEGLSYVRRQWELAEAA